MFYFFYDNSFGAWWCPEDSISSSSRRDAFNSFCYLIDLF